MCYHAGLDLVLGSILAKLGSTVKNVLKDSELLHVCMNIYRVYTPEKAVIMQVTTSEQVMFLPVDWSAQVSMEIGSGTKDSCLASAYTDKIHR